jgi:hypothetical protein
MPVKHSAFRLLFPQRNICRANYFVVVFVFFYTVFGISTLKYFGLTWDEGLGNLFFGERYFHFWAHMHFNVKDIPETIFFGLIILAFWGWNEHLNQLQSLPPTCFQFDGG